MAKFIGIPLTVSNGNRIPLTAQPELIPNSDFTSSSGWDFSVGSGASISNNQLTFANSPNNAFASTSTIVLQRGKGYVVKVEIASLTGDNPKIRLTAGGDASTYSPYYTSAGVYTHTFIANASSTNGKIQIYFYSDSTGSALINSISLKEIAATETPTYGSPEYVTNGEFANASDWNITAGGWNASGPSSGSWACDGTQTQSTNLAQANVFQGLTGKKVVISFEITAYTAGSVRFVTGDSSITGSAESSLGTHETIGVVTNDATGLNIQADSDFVGSVSNVSVKEVQYNYLQVADGGFTKSVKEGDVIFNTSTNTEGVVKEVIDNNVLLMSNDNFSTADEFFNVFAANGDTRGNQIIRVDNYIMSEYDENPTDPNQSSFWFAGGVNADKVVLTQLNNATNTFFVADVIEKHIEQVNAQSSTASRLNIPLDAFRDHEYNEVLTTTAITLS